MTSTSLDTSFVSLLAEGQQAAMSVGTAAEADELRRVVDGLPSARVAYDFLRGWASQCVAEGAAEQGVASLTQLAESLDADDFKAAIYQVIAAMQIAVGNNGEALVASASALNRLVQESKRKDEFFLLVLGSLLYDLANVHHASSQYRQAEREIEKSSRVFERLAKLHPQTYGAAHILTINASTLIMRSRKKQAEMLAQYQEASMEYMRMVDEGIEDAGLKLVESLACEGRMLVNMSRQREAIQYFTRALKMLTKIQPEFNVAHLDLSIDLGEALLAIKTSRDKGTHLLNTMLYKSVKLGAEDRHRRIVEILLNAKTSRLEIFSFWHKLFPR